MSGRRRKGESTQWLAWAITQQTDECIEWPFPRSKQGYGRMHNPETRRPMMVTHAVLEAISERRPDKNHFALHSCDNPPCINPRHLRWGTAADNAADRDNQGRGRHDKYPKLTDVQMHEVLTRHSQGETELSLAREFGVTRKTIRRARHGETWKHIDAPRRVVVRQGRPPTTHFGEDE